MRCLALVVVVMRLLRCSNIAVNAFEFPCELKLMRNDPDYGDFVGFLLRVAAEMGDSETKWDLLAQLSMRKFGCARNDPMLHRQLSNETLETIATDFPEQYRILKAMVGEMMRYCLLADKICSSVFNEDDDVVRKIYEENMASWKSISLAFEHAEGAELMSSRTASTTISTSTSTSTTTTTSPITTTAKQELFILINVQQQQNVNAMITSASTDIFSKNICAISILFYALRIFFFVS